MNLAEVGAELLFQVIADRAERTALIITTNLPFSEWTQVFPNARLCKALLDRTTDRAHIIETPGGGVTRARSVLRPGGYHRCDKIALLTLLLDVKIVWKLRHLTDPESVVE